MGDDDNDGDDGTDHNNVKLSCRTERLRLEVVEETEWDQTEKRSGEKCWWSSEEGGRDKEERERDEIGIVERMSLPALSASFLHHSTVSGGNKWLCSARGKKGTFQLWGWIKLY